MKSAVIIGAGDYIGAAIAKRFARGGYHVSVGRRNADKHQPLLTAIKAEGGSASGYAFDARDEDVVKARFAEIIKAHGVPDIVIFNVGGNVRFKLADTTARVYHKVWEMCAFAAFLVGREAAEHMTPQGHGSIFFTGATAGMRGAAGYSAFSGGKFALRALAQSMARELGQKNIHVAHLIIDAGVDTVFVRERITAAGGDPTTLPPDTLMNSESVGEAYWMLHHQSRDAWTHEMDIRPFGEKW
jgi:NAD(P)-dependent dehydrogenase (short-subunit alcohol dehydrogenase family)